MNAVSPRNLQVMWLPLLLGLALGDCVPVGRTVAEEAAEAPSETDATAEAEEEKQPANSESLPLVTKAESVGTDPAARKSQPESAHKKPVASKSLQPQSSTLDAKKPPATNSDKPSDNNSLSRKEESAKQVPATKKSVLLNGKRLIGGIALVLENQSQLLFRARVDTGAQSCSIHTDEIVIEDRAESMKDNIGKLVRIKLKNHQEESGWVETRINRMVRVKTSERAEQRYGVSLVLVYKDFEKEVRVTLNDRSHMNYPLLLGRNFLQGEFLVDVDAPEPK